MKNVIEYNDRLIGIGEDIQKYVLNELKNIVEKTDCPDDKFINDLENYVNLLSDLENFKESLVCVNECRMGGFNVEKLEVF